MLGEIKSYLTYLLIASSFLNITYINVILVYYKQIDVKIARTNRTWLYFQLFDRFLFPYFVSNIFTCSFILCLMIFGNRFIFECFIPNIRLPLKMRTYYVVDFTVLTYFTLNLDSVKFSQPSIP